MAAASQNVQKRDETVVTLKGGPSNRPYNKFETKPNANGNRTLVYPHSLGLNPRWLEPPVTATQAEKDEFPYWGHRIYADIKDFNVKSRDRRRVLVYDLRHGKADHNAWKEVVGTEKWAKGTEIRKQDVFVHEDDNQYCNIDPPLTEMGKKQARDANELFHKLKKHKFPMPTTAYISPLYRTTQTFKLGLRGVGIKLDNSHIVMELREQETGNSADILFNEYICGSKKPPPAGSKEICNWMEVEDQTGKNHKLEKRVKDLQEGLPRLNNSDCIVRVTHSLLNRHSLKNLEINDPQETVLNTFMLDEGGLFACVIEIEKATPETSTLKPLKTMKFNDYMNAMGLRRKTAFPYINQPTTPCVVEIEQHILARKKIAEEEKNAQSEKNIGSRKTIGSTKTVRSEMKVVSRKTVESKKKIDRRTNVGIKKDVERRTNVETRGNISGRNIESKKNNARSICKLSQ